MTVIIGVDPHKQSHTAVAICGEEREVSKVTVRATCQQAAKLLAWAESFGERIWAIESAGGLGYLLAQQLVDAGEHVVDVPPTLASRVRVLGTGRSDKNDPNDALSVAIAAQRSQGLRRVETADHSVIMRLLSKRNHDLGRMRARLICRLHHALADLSPGELPRNSTHLTPIGCSRASSRRPLSSTCATSSPSSWSMTCAASINRSKSRTDASARLSGHRRPRSPSSSASVPSSPAR
jgi:transposase